TAGGSPKKRWRKSCIDSGGPCPSSPARPTVEMFTTAGSARARTSANEGSRSPAAAGVTPSRAPSATRPPRPAPAVGIRSARRARPGLQLDDVALGIADVDRRADPARAVPDRGLADHLDSFRLHREREWRRRVNCPAVPPPLPSRAKRRASRRDPVPVEAVRHAVWQRHARHRFPRDVLGVEDPEVAGVARGVVDEHQYPPVVLAGRRRARHEKRLTDAVAGAEPPLRHAAALEVVLADGGPQ